MNLERSKLIASWIRGLCTDGNFHYVGLMIILLKIFLRLLSISPNMAINEAEIVFK
jgi:hypothetical protein